MTYARASSYELFFLYYYNKFSTNDQVASVGKFKGKYAESIISSECRDILFPETSEKRFPGAIYIYIFARSCEIPQIAAPCELSALLVMHEVYKGRVHSQKGPQPLYGVLSLEKDDE